MKLQVRSIRAALTRWYDGVKRDLPVAANARSLRHLDLRDHAATDARSGGDSLLRAFSKRLSPMRKRWRERRKNGSSRCGAAWGTIRGPAICRKRHVRLRRWAGFRDDYASIRKLAGVGEYTAASISSIAFGLPHAAIDGNVKRVMVRLMNREDANVKEQAGILLDRADPGRWNQALMELGATVCLPRNPLCAECPIARHCQARRHGTQNDLPAKRVKPATVRLERTLLVIRGERGILLRPSLRVKGFWDLPERALGHA